MLIELLTEYGLFFAKAATFVVAAFLIVGALISEDAELTIKNVGINPTRDGVIQILCLMGADIQITRQRKMGMEPVVDLVIRSSKLTGIEIPKALIANSIDEFPIIFQLTTK